MDVENGRVPDKYWILKKEIKDCFLIGNLLLVLLQVQLCFHFAKVSQFPIPSVSEATFDWIEFLKNVHLAYSFLFFLIKQYNNPTALHLLAVIATCSMAISWINFSLHSLSGISKFNSAPCDVLDGVSMNNSYVVEWKKSLNTKFVSLMGSFAKNSLSVKAFKVLQFEVIISAQKLSFEEVIEFTVENELPFQLVCSLDYSWPIVSMCKWTTEKFAMVIYFQRFTANLMIFNNALFFFFIHCFFTHNDPIILNRPSRWSTVFVFISNSFKILSTLIWFLFSMFLNNYFLSDDSFHWFTSNDTSICNLVS
ncbi:uncharacterized protein LOC124192139 [Daphnia pulex]|uniref:uncharacterized protein LOC124192139 n=1 Tax=Daphnia pulex TaxID=6669 RepID=UPI001EDD4FF1|nr:uncharacterized protein LOC124192139 [Daphnia pulex]